MLCGYYSLESQLGKTQTDQAWLEGKAKEYFLESLAGVDVYPLNAWGQAMRNFWRDVSAECWAEWETLEEKIEAMMHEIDGMKVMKYAIDVFLRFEQSTH